MNLGLLASHGGVPILFDGAFPIRNTLFANEHQGVAPAGTRAGSSLRIAALKSWERQRAPADRSETSLPQSVCLLCTAGGVAPPIRRGAS